MLKITFYKKYTLQLIISVCVLLLNTYSATAQVVVTSAGTVNMCVGGAYVTIPAFKVAEKLNTDFAASGSLQTYELSAPSDFEFNPGTGTVAIPATTDISFATLEVTATKITLLYFLNTTAQKDSFIFNGLQVRAVTTNSANDLRFTGGTASQNQNNLNQYAHAHFNSANANVSLSVSTNIVCTNGSDITLNGSPSGGAYTGSTGISGNTFKPAIAGVGSYVITYTATNNGCVGTDTVHIAVKEAPSVTFFGLASTYCSNDSIDKPLTGFPAGGTFSGSGITNSTFFNPKSAGVGNNKTITYQYSANGCQSSSTSQTNVLVAPSITISLNPDKNNFFTTDTVLIDGNPSYLSPGGTLTVTGDGVVTNVVGQSKFYPGVIGQGTSTITRTITTSNGCSATAKKTVTVISSSGGQIGGIADTVCQSANQITMTVNNDQGYYYVYYYNPSFGYTLDANAYIDTDHTNGIGVFIPTKASIGTYLIEFIGNNFGLAYTYVQVIGPPAVTIINIKPSYCSDASQFAIQYTTTGNGIVAFSGNGVNNKQFNPGAITSFNVPTVISYTYTDVTGCNSAGTVNTTIFQAPQNVGFTNLNSSYCDKDPNSPIIVNTNITPVGGVGIFSGIGVDTSNNTVLFNPSSAALFNGSQSSKNYSISFTYTTTNGCAATSSKTVAVNKLPDVHLFGFTTNTSGEYCFGASDINLNGSPSGGSVSISAKNQLIISNNPLQTNPSIQFQPSKGNSDTYYLKYTYTDGNQCTNSITDTAIINPRPLVYFTGLKTKYCDQDSISDLSAVPLPATGLSGSFSSVPVSSAVAGSKFIPSFAGVGQHAITYTYTDNNGCSNDSTISTIVYGKPVPHSSLSTVCEGDLIQFRDAASQLTTNSQAPSVINKWIWDIDTKNFTKQNLDTTLAAGSHSITYTTITNQGCQDTETKSVTIGSYPKTSFTWDKICNLEKTKFLNTTTINVGAVANVVWNFSDGLPKDSIVLGAGITGDTSRTFTVPATYDVILKAQSTYNCVTVDTQKVFILPAVSITDLLPYSSDFEANTGGWVSSSEVDTSSSWALGIPAKSVINTSATGDHAWVTNLTGSFKPQEISYVYSPCFTLTDITRPMIRMDIWSATRENVSGANLQYSLDGDNWLTLGEAKSDGVNWYDNESNIVSRPSGTQALNQDGWTGMDSVGWKNARHIFDDAIGTNSNIRFRISFAGTDDVTDGFAFDNVWVGDRTRLILAEHFTNNSSPNTIVENNTLNNLITSNLLNNEPKDIVELQYHTAFPGPDQMNARNIPDAGARALYYGVTQVPYSCLDGSYYNGNTLGITQQMIDTRSLYDPQFNITLAPNLTSGNVSGSVTIENKISVSNPVTVYISLLERFVNNVPGTNGEVNYQWVHAKFLPDAAGTSFSANWSAQSTQIINFNWDFTSANIYNPDKLAMIVFVQDNVTEEIYQTAYQGLGATVTTGIFDPTEITSTLSLYPNPANDITTVILSGKLSGEYNWVIIDELGRTVDQGKLKDQTDGFTINTLGYASGFYTLRLSNNTDGVKAQKFVVVH